MAEYLIQDTTLTAIADAIRTINGSTESINPKDMASHIPLPEEKTVALDFSTGDMEVTPGDRTMFSRVNITQPANLIPANIVNGVEIAGIKGIYTGGAGGSSGSDLSDVYLKYFTYFIDYENNQIILMTVRYDAIYEDTGSYDVVVPDTIAGLNVVIRTK